MSESSGEGTLFIIGVIIAGAVAASIPDAIQVEEMDFAKRECAPHGGLNYVSKRAAISGTIYARCSNGYRLEIDKVPELPERIDESQ